jgi:hypothetical protein
LICIVCNKEKSEKQAYKKTTCRRCYRISLHKKTEMFKSGERQREERKNRACLTCGITNQKRWHSITECLKCGRKHYRLKNKEKIESNIKSYKEQNKEKIRLRRKEYRQKHKAQKCYEQMLRQAKKVKACPIWINKDKIKEVYLNKPNNVHVDHIVPLNNPNVCGLHVPWNLQYLTAFDNISKHNKFDGTYENKGWKK